jgi:hypothetical protein
MALVWTCTLHAQPTFQMIYQSGSSYTLDLIELPGRNILTALGGTLLVNPEGHVEHASAFFGGGTYLVRTIKAIEDNQFYFTTGTTAAPCEPSSTMLSLIRPVLGNMDSLGTVLQMKRYAFDPAICMGSNGGLEVTSDKGALTWGRDRNFFALRVDSTLEPVWSKQIVGPGGFQFIKELPSGDLLAGITMDTAGAVVARMDADGNFLWVKSYIRPKGFVHDALIESDDSFIITGITDTSGLNFFQTLPSSFQPKLFMMKLNGDGEVQWCKGWINSTFRWYSGRPSRVVRTLDSNYAVLATLGMPENNLEYRPILMKTDTNGDTLWTRSMGANGYIYMARTLLPHSDGGYMFSGIVQGDLPGGNTGLCYIMKTDSMGHFGCQEQHFAFQTLDLFPEDSTFTLSSVESLAIATPILVNDSILDPNLFTAWDACTLPTDLAPRMERSRPMSVRPNPNTGRFTVHFDDPLMAESWYSVYDALGKLLYQRPWPSGKQTEEVDLSRFGRGTYVIRFTDAEGGCYQRVVVE